MENWVAMILGGILFAMQDFIWATLSDFGGTFGG